MINKFRAELIWHIEIFFIVFLYCIDLSYSLKQIKFVDDHFLILASIIDLKNFSNSTFFLRFFEQSLSSTKSLKSFFWFPIKLMTSSILFSMMNLVASTLFYCPYLCSLPIAWSSTAGFHHGSMKNSLLAISRFSPAYPHLVDIIKTLTSSFYLKALSISYLSETVSRPTSLNAGMPSFLKV